MMNISRQIFNTLGVAFAVALASCSSPRQQADFDVIPLPQEVIAQDGLPFNVKGSTVISYPADDQQMKGNAQLLSDYVAEATGLRLTTTTEVPGANAIVLQGNYQHDNKEAYRLTVNNDLITINGATPAGTFYGIQTLRKALPAAQGEVSVPAVTINDYPRFGYRGAHFDTSRHFFTADSVKRFVDILALHNINRFHWHITDDQGWRIEIKARPELTRVGSKRTETVIGKNSPQYDGVPYEGFYTQDEIRDIVRYAAERHVTIVPEIDLPGHMQAALAAYPELGCTGGPYEVWRKWGVSEDVLCAGNDAVYKFIEDVLTEVVELFPSEYIHVGGDECPKVRWAKCPKCQARIKALGLKADKHHTAEQRLQSYVIGYAEKFLATKGRKIIGWDEILEGGLSEGATVMSWRGEEGGIEAARQGHDAIMTPNSYLYFDYYQTLDVENEPLGIGGYVPIQKVYGYEPVSKKLTAEEGKHIIGVQANLWTEYVPTFSHAEYMELPRMAALSEVQWTMPEKKDFDGFLKRIPQLMAHYELQHYNYAHHLFDVMPEYEVDTEKNVIRISMSTLDGAPIHYTVDGSEPTPQSPLYTEPVEVAATTTIKAISVRSLGSSRVMNVPLAFNKATARTITMLKPICERYQFEGEKTLIDGRRGAMNYASGHWIAFHGTDLDAVVDLGAPTTFTKAWVRNYVEIGEEILDARSFAVEVSMDGKNYRKVASADYPAVTPDDKNGIFTHELTFDAVEGRYVRFISLPEKSIPAWHWGKGRPAFIFVDEVGVE